jgi:hypothetical protein
MSGDFLTFWFRGLQTALSQMDERSVDTLMAHCGRACSDSYPKQIYEEAWRAADTLDGFLDGLNQRFGETAFRRIGPQTIEAVYTRCGCDLVREGWMSDPRLCLCSLKSLEYNWEAVLGAGSVECILEQSVLGGADCCRFLVKIKSETE